MRNLLALAVVTVLLLMTAFAVVQAQKTAATSTLDFSLIFRSPSDPRPVKVQTGHFRWQNTRGRTEAIFPDSLWDSGVDTSSTSIASRGRPVTFVLADSATLARRYGRTQKVWVLTVNDTTRAGTTHTGVIDVTIYEPGNGASRDTSLFIGAYGMMCRGLIIDSVSVGFAPFDSIRAGDRTMMCWQTRTWQE